MFAHVPMLQVSVVHGFWSSQSASALQLPEPLLLLLELDEELVWPPAPPLELKTLKSCVHAAGRIAPNASIEMARMVELRTGQPPKVARRPGPRFKDRKRRYHGRRDTPKRVTAPPGSTRFCPAPRRA